MKTVVASYIWTIIDVHFNEAKKDDGAEPLRMEHFYFPLGLWLAGILLSTFLLLAEIIIHRRRKPPTAVANLTPEDPRVTQSKNLGEVVPNK